MGLRTYNHTFKHELLEKTVGVKAKKALASGIVSRLSRLASIGQYKRELRGIRGCTEGWNAEASSLVQSFCFGSRNEQKALPKQLDFDVEYDEWISHLPNLITIENMQEVMHSADTLFDKYVIVEDNRRTPEEETERVVEQNNREEVRKQKADAQAAKDDIERADLVKEYSYLVSAKERYAKQATASKNIKIELTRAFPGQKFSVRSDSFSMGDSVGISWTEGPTEDEVKEFTCKYQNADFDGMQDMSIPRTEGNVFRGLFGGSKFVSTSRTVTDERYIAACKELGLTWDKSWNYEHWDRVNLSKAVDVSFYVPPIEPVREEKPASGTIDASTDALTVIEAGRAEGNLFYLPDRHLSRELYVKTNEILKALGGKWNRKQKAHVFDRDIEAEIQAVIDSGSVYDKKKDLQIFETPAVVAEQMIGLAEIETLHRVLEPSAGTGNLLKAMPYEPKKVAIEIDHDNAEKLKGLAEVHECDFLNCNGDLGTFDRIVMNPPFKNGVDIKHINHALSYLKPGGRLVALCANGPRQQAAFKDQAEHWEALPEKSFKEVGTNVNVALLVLRA